MENRDHIEYVQESKQESSYAQNVLRKWEYSEAKEHSSGSDNNWLVGSWGLVTTKERYLGNTRIAPMTIEYEIIDEHTAIEIVTVNGQTSRETRTFTIDNVNSVLQFSDVSMPFNKANQTLNCGTKENPLYLRKE
ncbi:MAG: hypothetical protein LBP98_01720 [Tannerella sp.]|nr:hypothetical protein [Tannerella sp.]